MALLPSRLGDYPDASDFERSWRDLASVWGGRASVAGASVQGRAIPRYDFGREDAPSILLTGLIHGMELIGSLALLDFVRSLVSAQDPILRAARLVVLPIVNPDALHAVSDRLARGERVFRRCNANGVDLNRNFPHVGHDRGALQLLAGSRSRLSPYYSGPHPFSEPESRAVRDVALEVRPRVAVGFHSFGDLLLFPWAFTSKRNPRAPRYEAIGRDFSRAQPRSPYRVMQARQLYAVQGDLDDWLDAELGAYAFTVEVSRPALGVLRAGRLGNPFCWMNPVDVRGAVRNSTPGVSALVQSGMAA